MRQPPTPTLEHWDDAAPDPDTRALAEIAHDYRGHWIIWRSMSAQRAPGAWCARRADSNRAPAGLSAASPQELRAMIEGADR